MLQLDPAALATILALAAQARPRLACGLLVGRGGLGRREAQLAEAATALPADRARGRFDLHPGDWQRIDRLARQRGQDVVGVWLAGDGLALSVEPADATTAFEGYSYLLVAPAPAGGAPRLFAFELTIDGTEKEPVEIAPVAEPAAGRPPPMEPMPRIDDKNLGGHGLH